MATEPLARNGSDDAADVGAEMPSAGAQRSVADADMGNGRYVAETGGYELLNVGMGLAQRHPRLAARASAVLGWQRKHSPSLLHWQLRLLHFALRAARKLRDVVRRVFIAIPGVRWLSHSAEIENLKARNQAFAERMVFLTDQLKYYSVNNPVNVYINFARSALDRVSELEADVYVGHGVQSLPAAAALAGETGGRYLCDCIEIPSFFDRAVPVKWHVTNTQMLDCAFETYLRRADGVLTIGWALRDLLVEIAERVVVIPNYRNAEDLEVSGRLRDLCGISDREDLVLSLSTVASGFEPVIEALTLLPDHVHLASIGRFVPAEYRAECRALAKRLGVDRRFHCFDPVRYSELTTTVSAADVGLIVRDPAIPNNGISLPNRIFDYMFSSVPVCSPRIPDIARFIEEERMGAVTRSLEPASWAEAIEIVLAQKETMRANALAASRKYTWESLEDELFEALGRPRSVCFLGANQLHQNNRTRRMAHTLMARGTEVKICYLQRRQVSHDESSYQEDGITFVPVLR